MNGLIELTADGEADDRSVSPLIVRNNDNPTSNKKRNRLIFIGIILIIIISLTTGLVVALNRNKVSCDAYVGKEYKMLQVDFDPAPWVFQEITSNNGKCYVESGIYGVEYDGFSNCVILAKWCHQFTPTEDTTLISGCTTEYKDCDESLVENSTPCNEDCEITQDNYFTASIVSQ